MGRIRAFKENRDRPKFVEHRTWNNKMQILDETKKLKCSNVYTIKGYPKRS